MQASFQNYKCMEANSNPCTKENQDFRGKLKLGSFIYLILLIFNILKRLRKKNPHLEVGRMVSSAASRSVQN